MRLILLLVQLRTKIHSAVRSVNLASVASVDDLDCPWRDDSAPAYVLIYPNETGFLGSKHGYLYLTDTSQGPAGLSEEHDCKGKPKDITPNFNRAFELDKDHGWGNGEKDYLYKNSLWQESTQWVLTLQRK